MLCRIAWCDLPSVLKIILDDINNVRHTHTHTNFFLFVDTSGTLGDSRPIVSLAFHIIDYLKAEQITNAEVCLVLLTDTDTQSDQLFEKHPRLFSRKIFENKLSQITPTQSPQPPPSSDLSSFLTTLANDSTDKEQQAKWLKALNDAGLDDVGDIMELSQMVFTTHFKSAVSDVSDELYPLLLPYWLSSNQKRSITHYEADSLTIYIANDTNAGSLYQTEVQQIPRFKMNTPQTTTTNMFVETALQQRCPSADLFKNLPHKSERCDFGDTTGSIRFVTKYLTDKTRPTAVRVNGSLYLPICENIITEIRAFFEDSPLPKLIIICGPSPEWNLTDTFWQRLAQTTKVVIIGSHVLLKGAIKKALGDDTDLVNNIMCAKQFVEVADIHTLNADLILFSPGAGTCADLLSRGTAPIAPIQTTGGIGYDKMSNAKCIEELNVGPESVDLRNYENIKKAIKESQTRNKVFKDNAARIREDVLNETKEGIQTFCSKYLLPEKSSVVEKASGGSKKLKPHLYFKLKRSTAHNKRRQRKGRRRTTRKQSNRSKKNAHNITNHTDAPLSYAQQKTYKKAKCVSNK